MLVLPPSISLHLLARIPAYIRDEDHGSHGSIKESTSETFNELICCACLVQNHSEKHHCSLVADHIQTIDMHDIV